MMNEQPEEFLASRNVQDKLESDTPSVDQSIVSSLRGIRSDFQMNLRDCSRREIGHLSTDALYTSFINELAGAVSQMDSLAQSGIKEELSLITREQIRDEVKLLVRDVLYQPAIWKLEDEGLSEEEVITNLWRSIARLLGSYQKLDPEFILTMPEGDERGYISVQHWVSELGASRAMLVAQSQYFRGQAVDEGLVIQLGEAIAAVGRMVNVERSDWIKAELSTVYDIFLGRGLVIQLPSVITIDPSGSEWDHVRPDSMFGIFGKKANIAKNRLKSMDAEELQHTLHTVKTEIQALMNVWKEHPHQQEQLVTAINTISLMEAVTQQAH